MVVFEHAVYRIHPTSNFTLTKCKLYSQRQNTPFCFVKDSSCDTCLALINVAQLLKEELRRTISQLSGGESDKKGSGSDSGSDGDGKRLRRYSSKCLYC